MRWKDLKFWNRKKEEQVQPIEQSEARVEQYPVSGFDREIDPFFGHFLKGWEWPVSIFDREWGMSFSPRVNLSENDKTIEISAEMPGVDEKEIDVSLSNGVLSIKGEKKQEKEETNREYHRIERSYGAFRRMIPLSCEVEQGRIQASFKKGVLKIILPKSKKAREHVKKIEVKAA